MSGEFNGTIGRIEGVAFVFRAYIARRIEARQLAMSPLPKPPSPGAYPERGPHCRNCGTAPALGAEICGWPCGMFGFALLRGRNQARSKYYRRMWRRTGGR